MSLKVESSTYTFRVNTHQSVCLEAYKNEARFFIVDEKKALKIPIDKGSIRFPVDLTNIPPTKIASICDSLFAKIILDSEGRHHLQFEYKQKGGMRFEFGDSTATTIPPFMSGDTNVQSLLKSVPDMTNTELQNIVSVNLKKALKSKSFQVIVSSIKHKFPGETKERQARVITFKPMEKFDDFLVYVKRIFTGVKFSEITGHHDLIRNFVLGNEQTESDREEAKRMLLAAFSDKRGFKIIISQDGDWLDFELESDRGGICSIQ